MTKKQQITRRRFIGSISAVAAGSIVTPNLLAAKKDKGKKLSATDMVALGQSGIKVSRLGMGTGSRGGKVQRELGPKEFERVTRYGIERGLTFIDTADNYQELHEMIAPAIKGIDRSKLQIQCKIGPGKYEDPLKEIDRFRKEVGTDYFDSMLIHCTRTADWVEEEKRLRDLLLQAKDKGIIRAAGVSQHGLVPLRATAKTSWGDIRQVRINHAGASMDNLKATAKEPGDVQEVVQHLKKMHADGKGIIGMKLIGNGNFTDLKTRQESINFVMGLASVDAVVIGFKSTAEIDEAIENINSALAKHV